MIWRSSMMTVGVMLLAITASPESSRASAAPSSALTARHIPRSLAQTPTFETDRDQLEAELRQLHPDIVDVSPGSSTALYEDGTEFTSWSPRITLRAGLSIEEQEAIALTAAEYVIDFQRAKSGSLIPPNPDYPVYGGIVLFVGIEDDRYPQVDFVSFTVLSRSPVAVEISMRVVTEDDYAETVVARFADGQFTAIAADQPNPADAVATLLDTGFTQLYDGNLMAAEASFESALQGFRELSDVQGEYDALNGLLAVYDQTGQAAAANEVLQRQAEIAQSLVDPLKLRAVAGDWQCRAEWAAAIATYEEARDFYRRNRPDRFSLQDARNVLDQEVTTLASMAQTYIKAGQLTEAEATLREAITLLDQIFAEAQLNSGDDDFEVDEDIRQLTEWYGDPFSSTNLYQMLQHVLIRQDRPEAALVAMEQGRTQGLEELWAIKQPGERLSPPNLEEIKAIARQRDATLVTYSFDTFIDGCGGEVTPPQLLTWVITPNGDIQFHSQSVELSALADTPSDVQNLVQDTRLALGARGLTIVAANPERTAPSAAATELPYLQELHQLLIEPIQASLSSDPEDHVIFIPDFVLFMVPFAALQAADGSYLVERHTPLTAPSIQALSLTAQSRQRSLDARSNPLIVGNPTYAPVQLRDRQLILPPLPGAEQEARRIADRLETDPLIGDAATKTAILQRLSEASVMHFATHGLLEGVTPFDLPGAIAVAQTTGRQTDFIDLPDSQQQVSFSDAGLIETNEILLFRLRAELVVLSACNTGGGDLTGDGINGLSRAFIASGVPSVVVSLWAIPDAPTGELMTTFYDEWLSGSDKATALRTAMLTTMELYPDPINWAAFTLIGEAE